MSVPAYWSPSFEDVRDITIPNQGRVSGNAAEAQLRREFLEEHIDKIENIEDVQNWLRTLMETV